VTNKRIFFSNKHLITIYHLYASCRNTRSFYVLCITFEIQKVIPQPLLPICRLCLTNSTTIYFSLQLNET